MSWFSAVTGKAEDFLNKLDKSAADALQQDEETEETGKSKSIAPMPIVTKENISQTQKGYLITKSVSVTPSQSVPAYLKDKTSAGNAQQSQPFVPSTSTASSKSLKKKDSDEELFNFLNSKDSGESGKKRLTPISSRHHSRQSSTSSAVSTSSKILKPETVSLAGSQPQPTASQTLAVIPRASSTGEARHADDEGGANGDSPTTSHVSADMDALADAMKESPVGSDQSVPESDHADTANDHKERQLSSLELENRLLRNEVASLNEEMASMIKRAKEAETDLFRTKEKVTAQSNSASMHDQLVRELQARESDLTEALHAKDSQLAVLRVRLEEADRRVSSKEKTIEDVKFERERILKDHSDSSGIHTQALESMKDKMEEMGAALKREQSAYKQVQQEAGERQSQLQQERQAMVESLTAAEKRMSEEKAKNSELNTHVKAAKAGAEAARKELADYKDKAARILQSKERLISSLRDGNAFTGDSGISTLEFESLRQERDMIREELQQTKLTVENLRQELQDVENQLQQDNDTSQATITSLEDSLREEKRRREDAEQELLKQKQELQYSLDEIHKQKTAFQTRISDREVEIEKLRNQLMTKSMSTSSESELESRVRSLTESLIQKQTVLEALSTEKNSLGLQLERMEQQYRDLENAAPRPSANSQLVAVNDHDDDVRQRLPLFLREVPTDHEMTRRMKRAASTIDKFSIRLGVFLRRYPMARVFVILYMALLHVWVLIVMMTYQPEIHGMDYQPKPPE